MGLTRQRVHMQIQAQAHNVTLVEAKSQARQALMCLSLQRTWSALRKTSTRTFRMWASHGSKCRSRGSGLTSREHTVPVGPADRH